MNGSMETSSILLLVVSSAVSFALGRAFVYFRTKKREKLKAEAAALAAHALRDQPAGPPSKNKSKRKRQLQQDNQARR